MALDSFDANMKLVGTLLVGTVFMKEDSSIESVQICVIDLVSYNEMMPLSIFLKLSESP